MGSQLPMRESLGPVYWGSRSRLRASQALAQALSSMIPFWRPPMRSVVQETYGPPANNDSEEPLFVHRRSSKQNNRRLVILIHGLFGKRYCYWGDLPSFLYGDFGEVDLGLYQYATGLRRFFG